MLLTVKEVSEILKVNTNYVYNLMNSGLLPYMKLGSRKVRRETLERFLAEMDGKDVDEVLKERGQEQWKVGKEI